MPISSLSPSILERVFYLGALDTDPPSPSPAASLWHTARQVNRLWRKTVADAYLHFFIQGQDSHKEPIQFKDQASNGQSCKIVFFTNNDNDDDNDDDESDASEDSSDSDDSYGSNPAASGLEMAFKRMYHEVVGGGGGEEEGSDSSSGRRVVFGETTESNGKFNEAWERALKPYLESVDTTTTTTAANISGPGKFASSNHVLCFLHEANDTSLPGLRIDSAQREISFEWEGMLDCLLSESMRESRRIEKLGKKMKSLGVRDVMRMNDVGLIERMIRAIGNVKRDVRRERIVRERGLRMQDVVWDEREERRILRRIEECAVGLDPYSDGDVESDEEESAEEEEWEDDDGDVDSEETEEEL